MNKLLDPPGIVETITRYECPRCGNNCSCGLPYVPRTERATEYAQSHPTASVREIAKETGASIGTAYKAKAGVQGEHLDAPATTTGRDGKSYPSFRRKRPRPVAGADDAGDAAADPVIDGIVETFKALPPRQRERCYRRIKNEHGRL